MHIVDILLRILWIVIVFALSMFSGMIVLIMREDKEFAKDPYAVSMFCWITITALFMLAVAAFT